MHAPRLPPAHPRCRLAALLPARAALLTSRGHRCLRCPAIAAPTFGLPGLEGDVQDPRSPRSPRLRVCALSPERRPRSARGAPKLWAAAPGRKGRARGLGRPAGEAGIAQAAGDVRPKADQAAAPFPRASRGAHSVHGAGGLCFLWVIFSFSHFSETTATPNASPERINTPVFKLIPKRSVFSEMGLI